MAGLDALNNFIDPSFTKGLSSVITPSFNPNVPTPSIGTKKPPPAPEKFNDGMAGTAKENSGDYKKSTKEFTGAASTEAWGASGAQAAPAEEQVSSTGYHELTDHVMNQHSFQSPKQQAAVNKIVDEIFLGMKTPDELAAEAEQELLAQGVPPEEASKLAWGNGTDENPGVLGMLTAVGPNGLSNYDNLLASAGNDVANAVQQQASW